MSKPKMGSVAFYGVKRPNLLTEENLQFAQPITAWLTGTWYKFITGFVASKQQEKK